MSNETMTPWAISKVGNNYEEYMIFDCEGALVCNTVYGKKRAALIVRAVNSHDKLVEASEADLRLMGNLLEDLERIAGPAVIRGIMDRMRHTRDALALARGEVQPPIACAAALDVQWFSRQPATGEGVEFAARVGGRRYVAYGTYASIDEYAVNHGPTQGDVDMISRLLDEGYDPSTAVEVQL